MGPSKISGNEDHVSNPWGSAGKPPEMGAMQLPLQPWPGLDPSEQHRHVVKGSITRVMCCSASYSHMLHVLNQSALAKKQVATAWVTLPFPCPVGSSPSDSPQWLAQRHWDSNSLSYPPRLHPNRHPNPYPSSHAPPQWLPAAPQPLGDVLHKVEGRRVRIRQLARIKGERNAGKKGQNSVGFGGKALSVAETSKQREMWKALGREGLGGETDFGALNRKIISSFSGKGAVSPSSGQHGTLCPRAGQGT